MSGKKTVVVLGATGAQGGSVVRAFRSDDSHYHIRAVTRSKASPRAQALITSGVEVVEGDTSDMASLVAAFKNADMVFSATDFWGAAMNPSSQAKAQAAGKGLMEWAYENELNQGKNIIRAAAQTQSLQRLIFSGLADVSKWSGGKYKHSYHFDAKAHAINYAKEFHPDLWAKTSVIQAGWYLENWRGQTPLQPKKDASGVYDFPVNVPADLKLPLVAMDDDYGPLVKALYEQEDAGKNLIAYCEYISVEDMVATWSDVLKVPAKVTSVKLDINTKDPVFRELAEGYAFWEEFGYEARDDPTVVHPNQVSPCPSDFVRVTNKYSLKVSRSSGL